jgi:predicted nucleic acid-binding protein
MICADTSSLVALLAGEHGRDVELVRRALLERTLLIAPVSVAELLSDPDLTSSFEALVLRIPQLEITPGYWERAGKLRARLLRHRVRPKIADTLIAQSCLDHRVPLVSRDRDFISFQRFAGLLISALGDRVQ